MNALTIVAFCAVAASASPSGLILAGHGLNHNYHGSVGPAGVVSGLGASGPSGVVTGYGTSGPAGTVNGHGAVGPNGVHSSVRDDAVHGWAGNSWAAPAIYSHELNNYHGSVGPSGVVTGAGASGPSGVVTGHGTSGPAGSVNGHGAVGPNGVHSSVRDDAVHSRASNAWAGLVVPATLVTKTTLIAPVASTLVVGHAGYGHGYGHHW